MKKFIAFTKKEILEQIRTYKVLIVLCVFFFIGFLSPLTAKLSPEIFKSLESGGIKITIPTPTFYDAYMQLFKNITQMGLIVLLLIFSGNISNELSKGTLINLLSKGLSRNIIILSKFFSSIILWTIGLVVSVTINWIYTLFLFGSYNSSGVLLSLFCIWIFGVFILGLIIFSNILIRGNYGGLLLVVSTVGTLFILNIINSFKKFNPIFLVTNNLQIMKNNSWTSCINSLCVTVFLTLLCVVFSLIIFNKKQI